MEALGECVDLTIGAQFYGSHVDALVLTPQPDG